MNLAIGFITLMTGIVLGTVIYRSERNFKTNFPELVGLVMGGLALWLVISMILSTFVLIVFFGYKGDSTPPATLEMLGKLALLFLIGCGFSLSIRDNKGTPKPVKALFAFLAALTVPAAIVTNIPAILVGIFLFVPLAIWADSNNL